MTQKQQLIRGTTVKAIKFYNYKILSELKNPIKLWWKEDKLEEQNGKFILTVLGHDTDTFIIKFDKAEVIR